MEDYSNEIREAMDEPAFLQWYKEEVAGKAGLDPNPDHPAHMYDWRAAFRAGAKPTIDPEDGMLHWPSPFKAKNHPTRFKVLNGVRVDTITGQPAPRQVEK